MMKALYSGVAGLKTHQGKMDVIGNNIANVNTVAFKASQTTFSDIMYQNSSNAMGPTEKLGGVNAKQVGLGSLTAAIKTTIESAGAAQTTGEAFDLRLSDGNATNFFIVSNGQENLFTRAGSFYIDGAGNLAMTSTGYMVQGWQAVEDSATGEVTIRKDQVSSLRLLQPANQTSSAEATTDAYASGIVDKRDTNINSTDGYNMSLSFFDSLGYQYSAKFTLKNFDSDTGEYTIKLANIYDSNNVDILKSYINETKADYLKTGKKTAEITGGNYATLKDGWKDEVPLLLNRKTTLAPDTIDGFSLEYDVTDPATGGSIRKRLPDTDYIRPTEDKPYIYVYKKMDENGNDIPYAVVMSEDEVDDMLRSRIFGSETATSRNEYQLTSKFSLDDKNNIYCAEGENTYTFDPHNVVYNDADNLDQNYVEHPQNENEVFYVKTPNSDEVIYYITFKDADEDKLKAYPFSSIYAGAGGTAIQELMEKKLDTWTGLEDQVSFNAKTGALRITYKDVNYKLKFDAEGEGKFEYVASKGQTAVDFMPSAMGGQFSTINVDFQKMLMSNNGGSCTAAMDNGKESDPTLGTGRKLGTLTGIAVQQNGEIYGSYDNGNTRLLGQIAVAQFANPSGLEELGNNLFAETLNSGSFDGVGVVITSDGGKMETGQLEMSNVDLSREFTEMITTQRGFQANSRIITVSDTLLEELTNLKR